MDHDALFWLSHDDLIMLMLAQADRLERQTAQNEVLAKRVAELEAKLGKPPKTPYDSPVSQYQGHKPGRATNGEAGGSSGRMLPER